MNDFLEFKKKRLGKEKAIESGSFILFDKIAFEQFCHLKEKKNLSNMLTKEGFIEFSATYLGQPLLVHNKASRNVYYTSDEIFISTIEADGHWDLLLNSPDPAFPEDTLNDAQISYMLNQTNIKEPIMVDDEKIYPKVFGYIEIKSKELIVYHKENHEHVSIKAPNGRHAILEIFNDYYYEFIKNEKKCIDDLPDDPDSGNYKDWLYESDLDTVREENIYHFLYISFLDVNIKIDKEKAN